MTANGSRKGGGEAQKILSALSMDELCEFGSEALGPGFKAARTKSETRKRIKQLAGGSLDAAFQVWAAKWTFDREHVHTPNEDSPRLYHRAWRLGGPLGVLETDSAPEGVRGTSRVAALVNVLRLAAPDQLRAIAVDCLGRSRVDRLLGKVRLPAAAREAGIVQLCLLAEDASLFRSINSHVFKSGAVSVPPVLSRGVSDQLLLSPWGIVVIPRTTPWERKFSQACEEGVQERALALILMRFGGEYLRHLTSGHVAQTETEQVEEVVLNEGPVNVVKTVVSDANLWELLTSWGLAIPPRTAREELLAVLFRQLGLEFVGQPLGLYSLARELDQYRAAEGRPDLETARRLLLQFETFLEQVYKAYAELLIPRNEEEIFEVNREFRWYCNRLGVKVSGDRLSFGTKVELFGALLNLVESRPSLSKTLADATLRKPPDLRVLAGREVVEVVRIRNVIAHPSGEVPKAEAVFETMSRALGALLASRSPTLRVVPMLARMREERTDAVGWTRCILEDELGGTIVSTRYGVYGNLFGRHFFVFQRTNPVAVRPRLVLI